MEQQIKRMKSIISSMDEKNIFCIDCGIDKIDYVSINNGIIICSECYEKHKNFGYKISYLKSFSEKWDNYLLRFIQLGGNSNFFKYLYQYNLNELPIEKKYKTKAIEFYRQKLKSEVMGFDPPQLNFTLNDAQEIIDNIEDNYPEFKNYTYAKQVDIEALEKKYKKSYMKNMTSFFENFGKKIKNTANNFSEKLEEYKIKERMLIGTNNAINKVKNITVEAKDKFEGMINKNKYGFMNDKNFTNKVNINIGNDNLNEKEKNDDENDNKNKSLSDFLNNNNNIEKKEENVNENNNEINENNNNKNNENNNNNNNEKIEEKKEEIIEKNLNPEDELLKKISEFDDD